MLTLNNERFEEHKKIAHHWFYKNQPLSLRERLRIWWYAFCYSVKEFYCEVFSHQWRDVSEVWDIHGFDVYFCTRCSSVEHYPKGEKV